MAFLETSRTGSRLWLVSLLATCRLMGAFCESGLVIVVVTIAIVAGRCGKTETGGVGAVAAFSTRGSVLVVRTGVTVRVWGRGETRCDQVVQMLSPVASGQSSPTCCSPPGMGWVCTRLVGFMSPPAGGVWTCSCSFASGSCFTSSSFLSCSTTFFWGGGERRWDLA